MFASRQLHFNEMIPAVNVTGYDVVAEVCTVSQAGELEISACSVSCYFSNECNKVI